MGAQSMGSEKLRLLIAVARATMAMSTVWLQEDVIPRDKCHLRGTRKKYDQGFFCCQVTIRLTRSGRYFKVFNSSMVTLAMDAAPGSASVKRR